MTKEILPARAAGRDGFIDDPFNAVVPRYMAYLRGQRYADTTIRIYRQCLTHFASWAQSKNIDLAHIESTLIDKFLHAHLSMCHCPSPCKINMGDSRAALRHLLVLQAQETLGRTVVTEAPTPLARELERFRHYLANICGLADTTCQYRLMHVREFLASMSTPGVSQPTPQEVDHFMMAVAQRWKPASLGVLRSSLSSYFRFRALAGDHVQALIAALPRIADWTHATIPKALSEAELTTFLKAFDQSNATEQRDYAMARCQIDLGLRGQEVATLRLNAIDWRSGTLTITSSKGKRVQRMPVPILTGEAIARYLRYGRPQTHNRALFVRHVAPFDEPLGVAAIRSSMNRAFTRCGLADRFCNTHVLRHTAAVRLQRAGVPLKEIADILRHRSLNTTTTYARVDLEGLRTVALPWPGSRT